MFSTLLHGSGRSVVIVPLHPESSYPSFHPILYPFINPVAYPSKKWQKNINIQKVYICMIKGKVRRLHKHKQLSIIISCISRTQILIKTKCMKLSWVFSWYVIISMFIFLLSLKLDIYVNIYSLETWIHSSLTIVSIINFIFMTVWRRIVESIAKKEKGG